VPAAARLPGARGWRSGSLAEVERGTLQLAQEGPRAGPATSANLVAENRKPQRIAVRACCPTIGPPRRTWPERLEVSHPATTTLRFHRHTPPRHQRRRHARVGVMSSVATPSSGAADDPAIERRRPFHGGVNTKAPRTPTTNASGRGASSLRERASYHSTRISGSPQRPDCFTREARLIRSPLDEAGTADASFRAARM